MPVRFGMQVGNPPLAAVVHEMIERGVDRLIVLPMYPQYSATTTASATDVLFQALMHERRVPALRIVPPYYEHPAYLDAMAAVIRDDLARLPWQPDHYLLSFHGIPIRYAQRGDPYATHVKRTTAGLVQRLGWPRERWTQTFQSLFGREEWLKPYTETDAGAAGESRASNASSSPCRDSPAIAWRRSTRSATRRARPSCTPAASSCIACPCLNDHPAWIEAMKTLVREEGQGWLNG